MTNRKAETGNWKRVNDSVSRAWAGLRSPVSGFLLVILLVTPASAKDPRPTPQTRKAQAVSKLAFEYLGRAHKALEEEKFDEVLAVLGEMKEKSEKLNEYEQALMWQSFGYAYSSLEKYDEAADSFQRCLDTGGLPELAAQTTQYNLAQLYVLLGNYERAVEVFEKWLAVAENPSAAAHYMIAVAYMQLGDNAPALPHAEQALAKAGDNPKEAWLQIALSLYLTGKDLDQAEGVLKQLIARYPKKIYWQQLSAIYYELGDPKRALAGLELAYQQDLLSEPSELTNLAQLYLLNELPFKAAQVVESGLSKGVLGQDGDTMQLLGDSWLQARERKRALAPLARAAELTGKSEIHLRLGQLYLADEEWGKARTALLAALADRNFQERAIAQLLLGMAHAGARQWEAAESAFQKAQKDERTEKAATAWLANLEREKALDEAIHSSRQANPNS